MKVDVELAVHNGELIVYLLVDGRIVSSSAVKILDMLASVKQKI